MFLFKIIKVVTNKIHSSAKHQKEHIDMLFMLSVTCFAHSQVIITAPCNFFAFPVCAIGIFSNTINIVKISITLCTLLGHRVRGHKNLRNQTACGRHQQTGLWNSATNDRSVRKIT
jgi:hypothetical protein